MRGLVDGVYERIRALIVNHGIAPGARANIDELARALEVSGTPVREALARLESEGLVSRLPRRGYRVTELLTRKGVEDVYGLRLLLEPASAAAAARTMSSPYAAALEAELRVPHEDYRSLMAHDARLHELVLRMAGNEAVRQAFVRTHCHLHVYRLLYARAVTSDQTACEHRSLVTALAAGNPLAARDAMTYHLEAARDRLLSRFDELPTF
jgi:DNA-binding GntR family transcriptional regulator